MSINENDDVELTSYTSESTAAAEAPVASERPALTVPGSAVVDSSMMARTSFSACSAIRWNEPQRALSSGISVRSSQAPFT